MTSPVPVIWLTYTDGENPQDKWDTGLLRGLFDGTVWRPARHRTFTHHRALGSLGDHQEGAVVVFAAGLHAGQEDRLTEDLACLPWVLLILTADEGTRFDVRQVEHPAMRTWQMTPRPFPIDERVTTFLGEGWGPACRPALGAIPRTIVDADRSVDVFFAGQVTHQRRRVLANRLGQLPDGVTSDVTCTDGFAQGLPPRDYYHRLAAAKVAPCPGGPVTPDSFRAFEAMEAGCVPLLDAGCRDYVDPAYWALVAPGFPGPIVDSWRYLNDHVTAALDDWPANANRVGSWWAQHKRDLAWRLHDDLTALGAPLPDPDVDDLHTVLVPTSPIPSNPDTTIIETTVGSIRERLPHAEIIVMVDGVRPAQEHRRAGYDEYTRRLIWLCAHQWENVVPVVAGTLRHQSGMTRRAIRTVRTPLVFFVEHDMPLTGDIPFDAFAATLLDHLTLDVVRLSFNHDWEPAHEHMRIDKTPGLVGAIPVKRTWQWSQNPHVATTAYYREIMELYVTDEPRFVEEVMSGVVAGMFCDHGMAGWARHRIGIYAPDGNLARCYHLDGRQDDPPYPGA